MVLEKYPIVFLVGATISLVITPAVISIANSWGITDTPDARRIHARVTPRAGGIAIFVAFSIATFFSFFLPQSDLMRGNLDESWWLAIFPGMLLLLGVGLWDDAKGLQWWSKLAAHITAALLVFAGGVSVSSIGGVQLPLFLDLLATVIWITAFINAFNLIDGLDGLATGLGIIAALGFCGISIITRSPADTLILLGFIGACGGFLRYNFHPAKIFLGDTGSMFIGYTLATVSLAINGKSTFVTTLAVCLLAIGVPLFDAFLAVWRRTARGLFPENKQSTNSGIAKADLEHIHHRLLHSGLTQRKVASYLYTVNILLVAIGLLAITYQNYAAGIFTIAFLAAAFAILKHISNVELWDSGQAILRSTSRPQIRMIATIFYPLTDFLIISLTVLFSLYLLAPTNFFNEDRAWLNILPLWLTPSFCALLFIGAYRRVWSRARIAEFLLLGFALITGATLSLALTTFFEKSGFVQWIPTYLLFMATASLSLCWIRAIPRFVQDLLQAYQRNHIRSKRVLIFNGSPKGIALVRYLETEREEEELVGFLDDDINLRKRSIFGYPVLGGSQNLEEIIAKYQIDKLYLTTHSENLNLQELAELTARTSLQISLWQVTESPLSQYLELEQDNRAANF